jgi:hypothetical protein
MTQHAQVWAKVNAQVDERLREIITLLSTVPHLQTLESCQGGKSAAYIYLFLDDWSSLGRFLFEVVEPAPRQIGETSVSIRIVNGSRPMGKISFRAETSGEVRSALKRVLVRPRRFPSSRDMECTELRS